MGQLSKMSWLPDILVYRASIIPTIIGSVMVVTLFATGVAVVALWWGKEVGLTNNVGKSARRARWSSAERSSPIVSSRWLATGLQVSRT